MQAKKPWFLMQIFHPSQTKSKNKYASACRCKHFLETKPHSDTTDYIKKKERPEGKKSEKNG